MKKLNLRDVLVGSASALLVIGTASIAGTVEPLQSYVSGNPIVASEVNANFDKVKTAVDDNAAELGTLRSTVDANAGRLTTLENQSGGGSTGTGDLIDVTVDCTADSAALDNALAALPRGGGGQRFTVSGACGETDIYYLDSVEIVGAAAGATITSAASGETVGVEFSQNISFSNITLENSGTGAAVIVQEGKGIFFFNTTLVTGGPTAISLEDSVATAIVGGSVTTGNGGNAVDMIFCSACGIFDGTTFSSTGSTAVAASQSPGFEIDNVQIGGGLAVQLSATTGQFDAANISGAVSLLRGSSLDIAGNTILSGGLLVVDRGFVSAVNAVGGGGSLGSLQLSGGSQANLQNYLVSGPLTVGLNSSAQFAGASTVNSLTVIEDQSVVLAIGNQQGASTVFEGGVSIDRGGMLRAIGYDYFAEPGQGGLVTCGVQGTAYGNANSNLCNRLDGTYVMYRRGVILEDGGGGPGSVTLYGNAEGLADAAEFVFSPDGTVALNGVAPRALGREAGMNFGDSSGTISDFGLDQEGAAGQPYTLNPDGTITLFGESGAVTPDGSMIIFGGLDVDTSVNPNQIEDNTHILIRKR